MDWISHDDRTLKEHLNGLKSVADHLIHEKTQHFFHVEEFRDLVYKLISYHDLAKASNYFQIYLANALVVKGIAHRDYTQAELKNYIDSNKEKYNEWIYSPELKDHALFGAWSFLAYVDNDRQYNMDNLLFVKLLKRHHGYLRDFTLASMTPFSNTSQLIQIGKNIDFRQYSILSEEIGLPFLEPDISGVLEGFNIRAFKKIEKSLKSSKDSLPYFRTLFLYSLLLSADKGDVMLSTKEFHRYKIESDIVDKYKETLKTNFSINQLREEAYTIAVKRANKLGENSFFSITLPTGLGKTFIAYKTALLLKERFVPDFRIIYCLPFTSIIDQNASVFKTIFSELNIDPEIIGVHHHLTVPNLRSEENTAEYSEWEYFTEGWQKEITITTFVQLWDTLFANHNKQLRKYHNLVNSIIILDEVQSIKPELFPALEFTMEAISKYFNAKFILVTATQPFILKDKIHELCFKEEDDYFFKRMSRTCLDTSLLTEDNISEECLAKIVIERFNENFESILVICNTIRYSQNVLNIIQETLPKENVFYLSASIIPYTREKVLNEKVIPRLQNSESVILISTQVVEAGVDVDFNVVYRDFAPLSSINQAAGRCNRNASNGMSTVKLFRSGKERIYDQVQLECTRETLLEFEDIIPENQFYDLNTSFFKKIKKRIQDNAFVSNELIKSILALRFEDVGNNENYRLINEKYQSYNFFIPIDEKAEYLWGEYLKKMEIDEHFERKRAIKTHYPKMMRYVVKVPEYVYQPSPEDKEKAIIYDEDWTRFYDENIGYIITKEEPVIEIF